VANESCLGIYKYPKRSKCIGQSTETSTPKFCLIPHRGGISGDRNDAGSDFCCFSNSGEFGELKMIKSCINPISVNTL
jgi:hypothetical protein